MGKPVARVLAGLLAVLRGDRQQAGPAPGVLRVFALLLAAVWLVGSAARGGLRQASRAVVFEVRHPELWPSLQPDAREQWRGPYFDALAALQQERPGPGATVAVVVPESECPSFQSVPTRFYETIYRLYPLKPDFYLAEAAGRHHSFWFRSPGKAPPEAPPLFQHDYLIWADEPPGQPSGYRAVYQNEAAVIYCRSR